MRDIIRKIIQNTIGTLFNRAKGNLLGPEYFDKSMFFSLRDFDPKTTLEYHYKSALINQYPKEINTKETVKKLKNVAENYIDALQQKTLADISSAVDNTLEEARIKSNIEEEKMQDYLKSNNAKGIIDSVKKEIKNGIDKAKKGLNLIYDVEIHNAQNFGAIDGIVGASKNIGINDPYIFKYILHDERTCKYCKKIWLWKGNIPKVYKLSELSASPGKDYKNPLPSISVSHPNCRCVATTITPGFGFDESGKVIYIGPDYDEYKNQNS